MGKSLQVIVFLDTDCLISQDYMGKLNEIFHTYRDQGVTMIGVIPRHVNRKALEEFKKEYPVNFPVSVDKRHLYLRQYKASVTPEVFLVDEADTVWYSGAIDNWYYELGHHRKQTTEHFLIRAIEKCLQRLAPDPARTEPVGCKINSELGSRGKLLSSIKDLLQWT
jgi:hypothetical protein